MFQSNIIPKRALISVSDKTGLVDFAKVLHSNGCEIISTGGTAKLLAQNGIPTIEISDYTGFPEMMDGRVKTLHPKVHGGILGLRTEHQEVATAHEIGWIDMVICNLYPFEATTKKAGVKYEEIIENIDIGGPSMIRSASKNFQYVSIICDASDYGDLANQIGNGGISFESRQKLAIKAFGHTAKYDTFIHNFLSQYIENTENPEIESKFPNQLNLSYEKVYGLRYGENPGQEACLYKIPNSHSAILDAKIHQGIALSYNNVLDCEAGYTIAKEFVNPACVVIKHTNPCGVATDMDIITAFTKAYNADALSAFGGIIALNRECNETIALEISKVFAEIVIAPSYTPEALEILSKKKKLRVLEVADFYKATSQYEYKSIDGGMLVQESNKTDLTLEGLTLQTQVTATQEDLDTAIFGWKALKYVKSNGILLAKDNVTVGIGMGQVSRVDAVELAIKKAGDKATGSVLCSDAFFPFRDSIDLIASHGIKTIIQPGGSMRDQDVIDACNEYGIAMYFTGNRCFKH
jgi:phosphoribosylaminoimidazolecarboxamide formyltransferase / IMP cyclohydrolase